MNVSKAKRFLAWVLVFAVAFTTVFTNGITAEAANPKAVKSVKIKIGNKTVTKKTYTLEEGKSATLKVSVSPSSAKKSVAYKTSKKSVATVSKKGKVTAKKAGTAKITVTVTGKNKKKKSTWVKIKVGQPTTEPVTVPVDPTTVPVSTTEKDKQDQNKDEKPTPEVTAITVTVSKTALNVGETAKASYSLTPATVTTTVTWSSSDSTVATIDTDGNIVALDAGSTTITATTANGKVGTATITVSKTTVTSISVEPKEVTVPLSGSYTLTAKVLPDNATDRRVTWKSSDEAVVKVDDRGNLTPVAVGNAQVTATTMDGGFSSICNVTVADDTRKDVDKVELSVSNAITGYPNTVFVGTNARITIKATKDGLPAANDTIFVDLEGVSGNTSYYELGNDQVTLNNQGIGYATVKLKKEYSSYDAILDEQTESSWEDAAYAGFTLTADAGGATLKASTPVIFAQVCPATIDQYDVYGNSTAITVRNGKNINYKDLEPAGNLSTVTSYNSVIVNDTTKKYYEEYIVDQQVSSSQKDHSVVLDASPVLIVPASSEGYENGSYEQKLNYECKEYDVYQGVEDGYVVEDVPGGLVKAKLKFGNIQLSDYTRIVVLPCVAGTNIPCGEPQYITSASVGSFRDEVTLPESMFKKLNVKDKIDVRVYVESFGQVNEDSNIGFSLVSISGEYNQEKVIDRTVEKLSSTVTWSVEDMSYEVNKEFKTADEIETVKAILGDKYIATNGYKYTYTLPSGTATGNAIITIVDPNGNEKNYMYPTMVEDNKNVFYQVDGKYDPDALLTATTNEMIEPLKAGNYTANVDENGDYKIDSTKAGFINVKASVNIPDVVLKNNTVGYKYDIYSSVQWTPVPSTKEEIGEDYYALAGQTVTLEANVKDTDGINNVEAADVFWYFGDDSAVKVVSKDEKTNGDGKAYLVLKATNAFDLTKVKVDTTSKYRITWKVKNQAVVSDYVNIHWVQPGIYYKNDYENDAVEVNTAYELEDRETNINTYIAGSNWILATKVAGRLANDEDGKVVDISNVKIDMENMAETNSKADVKYEQKANGKYLLTNDIKGKSKEIFALNGFVDTKDSVVITIETEELDAETQETYIVKKQYTSVGEGEFEPCKKLTVNIDWVPANQILSIIAPSGKIYAVDNNYSEKYSERGVYVYLKVNDSVAENPCDNAVVTLTSEKGTIAEEYKNTKENAKENEYVTDENGLIPVFVSTEDADADGKVTISATINNGTPVSETINFVQPEKEFEFESAQVNSDDRTITVKFNTAVDASVFTKDMFSIVSNSNKIAIDKIEKTSDASKIVITVKDAISESDVSIAFNPIVLDTEGKYHYMVNKEGSLFTIDTPLIVSQ